MKTLLSKLALANLLVVALLPNGVQALSLAEPPMSLDPPVSYPVLAIDNGDKNFKTKGRWSTVPLDGFAGDFAYAERTGNRQRPATASWNYKKLKTGTYEVWVTWVPFASLSESAVYTVYAEDSTLPLEKAVVNQRLAPSTPGPNRQWQHIATVKTVQELRVQLQAEPNGYVVADAVRLVPVLGPPQCIPGETLPSPDDCNTCACTDSGEIVCTFRACPIDQCEVMDCRFGCENGECLPGPVCGNGICEDTESAFGCDPSLEDPTLCDNHNYCPEDCLEPIEPACTIYDVIEPPEGCKYVFVEDENGCHKPELLCEAEPQPIDPPCPVYALLEPGPGCYYDWSKKDENDCPVPNLICEDEPIICACPDIYAPVCGVDGKTYSNSCYAEQCGKGVEVAHEGECGTPDNDKNKKWKFLEHFPDVDACAFMFCPQGCEKGVCQDNASELSTDIERDEEN